MSPPTSSFFLVRGRGVHEIDWVDTPAEKFAFSTSSRDTTIRTVEIPPSPQNSIAPLVRIFPPQTFSNLNNNPTSRPSHTISRPSANSVESHPVVQPPSAQRSLSLSNSMIARPSPSSFSQTAAQAEQRAVLANMIGLRKRKHSASPAQLPPLPKRVSPRKGNYLPQNTVQEKGKVPPNNTLSNTVVKKEPGSSDLTARHSSDAHYNQGRGTSAAASAEVVSNRDGNPVGEGYKRKKLTLLPSGADQPHLTPHSGLGHKGDAGQSHDRVNSSRSGSNADTTAASASMQEAARVITKKEPDSGVELNLAKEGQPRSHLGKDSRKGRGEFSDGAHARTRSKGRTAPEAVSTGPPNLQNGSKSNAVTSNGADADMSGTSGSKGNGSAGDGRIQFEVLKDGQKSHGAVNKAPSKSTMADNRAVVEGGVRSEMHNDDLSKCCLLLSHLVLLHCQKDGLPSDRAAKARQQLRTTLECDTEQGEQPENIIVSENDGRKPPGGVLIERRGLRFKFLGWTLHATKHAKSLDEIAKEAKNFVDLCNRLESDYHDGPTFDDNQLLMYVTDLNTGAGTVNFLAQQTQHYLHETLADEKNRKENMERLKTALNALKDATRWVLFLTNLVDELWRTKYVAHPNEKSLEVQKFCTNMNKLVTDESGQAKSDGILVILRDIKKGFPSAKEFPNNSDDGKPYFARRKKVGDDVRAILPKLAIVCAWCLQLVASAKDEDERSGKGGDVDSGVSSSARKGNAKRGSSNRGETDVPTKKQTSRENPDGRLEQKEPRMKKVSQEAARRATPSTGMASVSEKHSRGENGTRAKSPAVTNNPPPSTSLLSIPRRSLKKGEKETDPPKPQTKRVATSNGVDVRRRGSTAMLDNAALVKYRLANGGMNAEKKAREEMRRNSQNKGQAVANDRTGSDKKRISPSNEDSDRLKKKKKIAGVRFALKLVVGSKVTPHEKEEISTLFQDGYDLLGGRNEMQDNAVTERAKFLTRGSVFALYGYLRGEFSRMKKEAEKHIMTHLSRLPLPEVIELRFTPSMLKQIARRIPQDDLARLESGKLSETVKQ